MTQSFPKFRTSPVAHAHLAENRQYARDATPEQHRYIADLETRLLPEQISDLRRAVKFATPLTTSHAASYISAMRVYLGERSRGNKNAGRRAAAVVRIWEQLRERIDLAEVAARVPVALFAPDVEDEVLVGEREGVVTSVRPGYVRVRGPGIPTTWIPVERLRPA